MHKSDYLALRDNAVWKKIVSTLNEVKIGLNSDLAEYDPITQTTKLARAQGRLAMVDFLIELPEDILREIEENIKLEESKDGKRRVTDRD